MLKNKFSLRLKTYIWLIGLTLGCFSGYYLNHLSYNSRIFDLFASKQEENLTLVNSIISLDKQRVETLANDYTYWDDMVSFVSKPDTTWASENLDAALLTFDVEGIWVFKMDGSLVYSVKTDEGKVEHGVDFYLDSNKRSKLFNSSRTISFYLEDDKGQIEEIHGATIHPSNDSARKTPPAGYMLVTRDLNTAYTNRIGTYTNGRAEISESQPNLSTDQLIADSMTLSSVPLLDIEESAAGYLNIYSELPTLKQLSNEVDRQRRLTILSYVTFYITIAWLIVLYGQGLVKKRKSSEISSDDTPKV